MRGYVLAGGRSSRMGEDKAGLRLGGRTLLEIAMETMRSATPTVTILGERQGALEGARSVPDAFPGCGPMGGMEAAMRDCREHGAEWAMFLPVDMPLVPAGLMRALADRWVAEPTARVCLAEVDGWLQPLVSAVHVEVLPWLRGALERGEYKLQPLLRAEAADLAAERGIREEEVFARTPLGFREDYKVTAAGEVLEWTPSVAEWSLRRMWFANSNTPVEFERMEQAVNGRLGLEDAEESTATAVHLTEGDFKVKE